MNQRETPHPFDARSVKNFNNFYCHLPGGRYREADFPSSERDKKLIADLDKVAGKLGIDAKTLYEEMSRGHAKVWEAINSGKPQAEAQKIADEGEVIRQEVHKKLIPLFEELIRIGYSPNELMA